MSFVLNGRHTEPKGLKAMTGDEIIFLGDYTIGMKDFLSLAFYALTNTNLKKDDPRLQFVQSVQSMKVAMGYPAIVCGKEVNTKRLHTDVPPVLDE